MVFGSFINHSLKSSSLPRVKEDTKDLRNHFHRSRSSSFGHARRKKPGDLLSQQLSDQSRDMGVDTRFPWDWSGFYLPWPLDTQPGCSLLTCQGRNNPSARRCACTKGRETPLVTANWKFFWWRGMRQTSTWRLKRQQARRNIETLRRWEVLLRFGQLSRGSS